jgi:hypothetical protein
LLNIAFAGGKTAGLKAEERRKASPVDRKMAESLKRLAPDSK